MGKVKNKRQKQSETDRPDTLTDQILEDKSVRVPGRTKIRQRKEADDEVTTLFLAEQGIFNCLIAQLLVQLL